MFSVINRKIDRVAYLRRNKKVVVNVCALWLVLSIGSHLIFNYWAETQINDYLASGAAAVERLAEEISPALLEDEFLGLSRKVADFTKDQGALFAKRRDGWRFLALGWFIPRCSRTAGMILRYSVGLPLVWDLNGSSC